jgi:hypothetical protein
MVIIEIRSLIKISTLISNFSTFLAVAAARAFLMAFAVFSAAAVALSLVGRAVAFGDLLARRGSCLYGVATKAKAVTDGPFCFKKSEDIFGHPFQLVVWVNHVNIIRLF